MPSRRGEIKIGVNPRDWVPMKMVPIIPQELWQESHRHDGQGLSDRVPRRKGPCSHCDGRRTKDGDRCVVSRLFYCAICGAMLHQDGSARRRTWVCRTPGCRNRIRLHEAVGLEILEKGLKSFLESRLPALETEAQHYMQAQLSALADTTELKRRLTRLTNVRARLEELMGDPGADGAPVLQSIADRYRAINAEVTAAETQLAERAGTRHELSTKVKVNPAAVQKAVSDLRTALNSRARELRHTIGQLLGRIHIQQLSHGPGVTMIEGFTENSPANELAFFGHFLVPESGQNPSGIWPLSDLYKKQKRARFSARRLQGIMHVCFKSIEHG